MWSRQDLKERSKGRLKTNYWKMVLAALLLVFIVGSGSNSFSNSGWNFEENIPGIVDSEHHTDFYYYDSDIESAIDSFFSSAAGVAYAVSIFFIVLIVIFIIVCLIVIPVRILLLNPLEVGCKRFFGKNMNEDAQLKEICYSFDNGYKNIVKTMFFRDLYTFLWSLLFVIPGIVKSYEYRMVPYLLGEYPGMDKDTAFAVSRQMMNGNKWNAFVLDLSFLGWQILNACTLGILGIFYVNPYMYQTDAALYLALRLPVNPQGSGMQNNGMQDNGMQNNGMQDSGNWN